MHSYLEPHEWKLVERGFEAENLERSEALFSIGNGHMGQRANFEEDYSGPTLRGSYVAGVYYPDKTRVGWWKNGYPEYFAKVLNSVNWIGIRVGVQGENLDLNRVEVTDFVRELDFRDALLSRQAGVRMQNGSRLSLSAKRFVSMARPEIGAIEYRITAHDRPLTLELEPYLDFDVRNKDSNYDEGFWEGLDAQVGSQKAVLSARTRKLDFRVASAFRFDLTLDGKPLTVYPETVQQSMYVSNRISAEVPAGKTLTLTKYVSVLSSLDHAPEALLKQADERASEARRVGFDALLEEHKERWAKKWELGDIRIEGDVKAQQGIRYSIFQLHQTYTGEDERLNIGPKGFTGEKYGGSTYWDTEAYCLPFYLGTAEPKVARQLLTYRYKHLSKAIENAAKLGFHDGAALYPMVTMNGEECHNEWEITFEEIHRNGAIAFAVYNYLRHTQDTGYLLEGGLDVLVGIARFWAQRVHWSERRATYVMHGVTGPNEYENNVNNNWYTSYIARWCLVYAGTAIDSASGIDAQKTQQILEKLGFDAAAERERWKHIAEHLWLPEEAELGIFIQNEGFLDKELIPAAQLPPAERPINQHWSWDRILRSCYIKQADVLQGVYLFEEDFDRGQMERNFDFYEPLTVHESSLSPCVHSILAARLGRIDKAYELYLRTARLDLDDYNHEVAEGLHITSMAGSWMSVVQGFGGMRWEGAEMILEPALPAAWKTYAFHLKFRSAVLEVSVTQSGVEVRHRSGGAAAFRLFNQSHTLEAGGVLHQAFSTIHPQ